MTVLACKDYDGPASYLAESTELVAVDPAHLAVKFTAPPSRKVLVRLTANVFTEPNFEMRFGLLGDGSQVGPIRHVAGGTGDDGCFSGMVSVALIVRNLEPGSEHTYQWAFASNVEAVLRCAAGDGWPPAVMEIIALP